MKKWIKRTISLLLASGMVLSLAGCGDKQGTDPAVKQAAKEGVYKYDLLDIVPPEREDGGYSYSNLYTLSCANDRVSALLSTEGSDAEGNWSSELKMVSVKLDGTDKKEMTLLTPDEKADGSYMNNMAMTDNFVYGVLCRDDYENVDEYGNPAREVNLICWNMDAQEQWRLSLIPENFPPEEWFSVNYMVALNSDQVLVYTRDAIDVYDSTGTKVNSVKMDENINYGSMFVGKSGNPVFTIWSDDWSKQYLSELNLQTGQLEEQKELPFNVNVYTMISSKNYDMLLSNSTGLYSYNYGDTEPKLIMNYMNSDLPSTSLYQVAEISDTQFVACYYDTVNNNQNVSLFSYVDPSEIIDKEVIVIGGYYVDSRMRTRAIEFNKTNEKYRITVKDYSQYITGDDYLSGYTQLNNDILAGNVPDIMILDDNMPIDSYIAKGLFADIYKFMDADEEINREDYFQNVFDAYSVNGKLYMIVPTFNIWTVLGKTSDVGEEPGWTMQEMLDLLASKPEGTSLFGADRTRDSIMWYATMMALPQYMDRDTGKCNFNSDGFKELLELLKTFPSEVSVDYDDPNYWNNYDSQYRSGATLLMPTTLSNANDLIYYFGQFGEPVTFIGFPSAEGNGAVINNYDKYAISAKSGNQEGAWEFMRYYFMDEYQNDQYQFSINKNIWREKAMEATKPRSWEDENGEIHYEDYTTWVGDQEVKLDPLTEQQVDELFEYVSSINQAYFYDQSLVDIINEEAAPFFEGQKTVDEVVEIIQGRVQLYVDEAR